MAVLRFPNRPRLERIIHEKGIFMAKESSFDVVSAVDMQEVDNAFGQAKRELTTRYDRKTGRRNLFGQGGGRKFTVSAPSDFVAKRVIDVLGTKLIRRGIDLASVKWATPFLPQVKAFVRPQISSRA